MRILLAGLFVATVLMTASEVVAATGQEKHGSDWTCRRIDISMGPRHRQQVYKYNECRKCEARGQQYDLDKDRCVTDHAARRRECNENGGFYVLGSRSGVGECRMPEPTNGEIDLERAFNEAFTVK